MLTKLSLTSWCESRAFLSCPRFWRARERLCKNWGRSLLGMRGMLLGYSFKPRSNIRALSTAGSVMNISFSINGCPHTKFQFDERKQDWQVYDIDVTNVVLLKFRFFFVVLIKVLMAEPWLKKKEWARGLWNIACQKTPVFWIVRTDNGLVEGHTYVNHVRWSFAYFPREQMTNC